MINIEKIKSIFKRHTNEYEYCFTGAIPGIYYAEFKEPKLKEPKVKEANYRPRTLEESIELARNMGVPEDQILHLVEEIDNYFEN